MLKIPKQIIRPARYIGTEPNRVIRDAGDVDIRFALCYPDIYEVGMSYYGHFLLYELINNVPGVWCERCFAPWIDMDQYMRENNIFLCTLESRTPLRAMDFVGFSLTYELNVTNVLNMLDLGGIRIRSEGREDGPIVIGGGPLMLNPGPYERFFDLIVVGEADEILVSLLTKARALKGMDRIGVIRELSRFEGAYSPLFKKDSVKRLYVKDLDRSYHPVSPPLPVVGSIHNRLNVEISRGCGNGCRFCLAGFGYRPYRERSLENVRKIIDEGLKKTGYEEVSLLSLSTGDYSCLFDVMEYVRDNYKGISISLPSLKIGSIGEYEIGVIGNVARTGLTFALEAASDELRCRLNKNIDLEMLVRQLPLLKKYGWRRLKLYLMIGFPWEKEEDFTNLRDILPPFRKEGIEINLSVSPFVPKPHTPFQWLAMDDENTLHEKMNLLKGVLKGKGAKIRYRDIKLSVIEGVLSRGDERLSGLFEYLFQEGVRLEAWREFFHFDKYERWFSENGLSMLDYTGPRRQGTPLPWDFVDPLIDSSFMEDEYDRAMTCEKSIDCYSGCAQCGIGCDATGCRTQGTEGQRGRGAEGQERSNYELQTTNSELPRSGLLRTPNSELRTTRKYTFRYGKYGDARYMGHIDTMNILVRIIRAAGIRIRMHGKYHPLPRIKLSEALPIDIESVYEFIEIETEDDRRIEKTCIPQMNNLLPKGMKIYGYSESTLKDMVEDFSYILVTEGYTNTELTKWKEYGKRHYFIWKEKGIKHLWLQGDFVRIIKTSTRRIHGI